MPSALAGFRICVSWTAYTDPVSLCVCVSVCRPVGLSVFPCLYVCKFACLSVYVYVRMTGCHLPRFASFWLLGCLAGCLVSGCLLGCLGVWMSGCLSVWVSGCLSVWVSECLGVWVSDCLAATATGRLAVSGSVPMDTMLKATRVTELHSSTRAAVCVFAFHTVLYRFTPLADKRATAITMKNSHTGDAVAAGATFTQTNLLYAHIRLADIASSVHRLAASRALHFGRLVMSSQKPQ